MVARDVGSEDSKDEKQHVQIAGRESCKDHRRKGRLSKENREVGGAFQQESRPTRETRKLELCSGNLEKEIVIDTSFRAKDEDRALGSKGVVPQ